MSTTWEAPGYTPGQFTVTCGRGNTMVTIQPVGRGNDEYQVVYSNDLGSMSIGDRQLGTMGGPYKPRREGSVTGNKPKIQRAMKGCVACLPNPEKGCCFRG